MSNARIYADWIAEATVVVLGNPDNTAIKVVDALHEGILDALFAGAEFEPSRLNNDFLVDVMERLASRLNNEARALRDE